MSAAELVSALATHGVLLILSDEGHLRARGRRGTVPVALQDELHDRRAEVAAYLAASSPIADQPGVDLVVLRWRATDACDAAYLAFRQHKDECPGCTAGRRCDEGHRLDGEYHARWREQQDACAACGDAPQALRPDREPGDDNEGASAWTGMPDALEAEADATSGGTTSTSPGARSETGQCGQPSEPSAA